MKFHKRTGKPVNQYDRTGTYLATFESIQDAYRKTGVFDTNISHVCLGNRRTAGGFIWRYLANDYSLSDVVYCQCCGKVSGAEDMINISSECLEKLKKDYN